MRVVRIVAAIAALVSFAPGGGTLVWIGLLVLAVVVIARVWASVNSY